MKLTQFMNPMQLTEKKMQRTKTQKCLKAKSTIVTSLKAKRNEIDFYELFSVPSSLCCHRFVSENVDDLLSVSKYIFTL